MDEVNMSFVGTNKNNRQFEYGDEFLTEYAYRYTIYGDIMSALDQSNLTDEQCTALINTPNSLYSIYQEWMKTETDHMVNIRDCISEAAQHELNLSDNEINNSEETDKAKITALVIEPDKTPYVKVINNELESLQSEVDGYIEAINPFDDNIAIICNEEGKLLNLPLNRALRNSDNKITDVLAGTFLIAGENEGDFVSLSEDQISRYTEMFKEPETILFADRKTYAFPSSDLSKAPVYYGDVATARLYAEIDTLYFSHRLNLQCKSAIEESLERHYTDNYLDSKAVAEEVISKFGEERVKMVLANTCNHLSYDGRIDNKNKEWANEIRTPAAEQSEDSDYTNRYIVTKPHIGLVDLLCSRIRKDEELSVNRDSKESVMGKINEKKNTVQSVNTNSGKSDKKHNEVSL